MAFAVATGAIIAGADVQTELTRAARAIDEDLAAKRGFCAMRPGPHREVRHQAEDPAGAGGVLALSTTLNALLASFFTNRQNEEAAFAGLRNDLLAWAG
jgi:hypothetical protein